MMITSALKAALVSVCLLVARQPATAAEDDYPEVVVTMEQMMLAKPLRISFPTGTTVKSKETRTVVIFSHVGKDGRVVKSKIQQASGAHHVDEAVLLAMRHVEFLPHRVDGAAAEVTVAIPVHLARDDIQRDRR